jgi:hypothetical protein
MEGSAALDFGVITRKSGSGVHGVMDCDFRSILYNKM